MATVSRDDASVWDFLAGRVPGTVAHNIKSGNSSRNRDMLRDDVAGARRGVRGAAEAVRLVRRGEGGGGGGFANIAERARGGGVRAAGGQHDRTGSPGLMRQMDNGVQAQGAGAGSEQSRIDQIMAMLGGGGGMDLGALAGSFDAEIGALRQGGQRMAGLTNQLIGNIGSSAAGANKQIGGFFNYAAGQANAGRPVIGKSYDTARTNVNQTYDQLAGQLAGLPQASADAARAAGGSAAGSSVADRVAVAAAPFAAAGESSRAASQANLATHSTAGQDYLTQLASAAPSEAAQSQAAVTGRANQAVTHAQMQLAAQQAEIEARAASLEGSKQRALLEASADTAGSTMENYANALNIFEKEVGLGLAAPGPHAQGAAGMSPQEMLAMANTESTIRSRELKDAQRADPNWHLNQALAQTDVPHQKGFEKIRNIAEQHRDDPSVINEVLGSFTGVKPGKKDKGYASTLDEVVQAILAGKDTPSLWTGADPQVMRELLRLAR